ncbi:oxalate oxidase [Tricholoma matsutake]|nr:oxalate oxidase [Tricholoma matsutake 945]
MISQTFCVCALLFAGIATAAPAASQSASAASSMVNSASSAAPSMNATGSAPPPPSATLPTLKLSPNGLVTQPQPIRGNLGAPLQGPTDESMVLQNLDLIAPPTTDHGTVNNAKWPFSLSHNRLQTGGWARQQNAGVMPIATAMAGVNMRLEPGAVRELHWHKTSEWAYVIKGSTQVTAVDAQGRNFVQTVNAGDLWFFPPGVPHSLQATDADPQGTEFLLVFNDGAFSEDETFLLTDWMAHVPAEVLALNFQTNISAFANLPASELYIFPAELPQPDSSAPTSPQGTAPNPFAFALSKVNPTNLTGGSVRIVDSTTFKISTTIAAAEVTVEPGAMRELHWHPTEDEWSFFIEGQARVTIFASQSNARTFDYQAGDIGYVPSPMGHYVQNIGNTTLKFLEIFNSPKFEDISLNQWLALTPPALVKEHLGFSDATMALLSKTKPIVV